VLEGSFTSAADVGAAHAYRFLPLRLLMKDQFRSDLRIARVTAPLLFLHGGRDWVVPIALGERLYALANEPSSSCDFPMPATKRSTCTARRMRSGRFSCLLRRQSRSHRIYDLHRDHDRRSDNGRLSEETEQVRFCKIEGNILTYTTAPAKNPLDGNELVHLTV
jgi:hypothetical protein